MLADAQLAPLGARAVRPGGDAGTRRRRDHLRRGRHGRRRPAARPRLHPGPSPDHLLATRRAAGAALRAARAALAALADIPETPAWRLGAAAAPGRARRRGPRARAGILAHRAARPPPRPAPRPPRACSPRVATRAARRCRGRPRRAPVGGEPLVEVVVLFRDRPELLERCADSVLERHRLGPPSAPARRQRQHRPARRRGSCAASSATRAWSIARDERPVQLRRPEQRGGRGQRRRLPRLPQQRHRGHLPGLDRGAARRGPAAGGRRGRPAAALSGTGPSSTPAPRSDCTATPAIRSPDWRPTPRRRSGAPATARATGSPSPPRA